MTERADDTNALVRRARSGEQDAWGALVDRYYRRWLGKYHDDLGTTLRKQYDTEDLVHSALGDAIRDIGDLRSEGAFFVWVTSIMRHKLAAQRRRLRHEVPVEDAKLVVESSESTERLDEYISCLETILRLFPEEAESMAAVVLKHLDGLSIDEIQARLGWSRRTAYRRLEQGTELLKKHLDA